MASTASAPIPVFNMQPDPGHVATLSASLLIATIPIEINLVQNSNGQYHLTATISDTSSLLTLEGADLTLWGVPGDPSHDSQRCGQLAQNCVPFGDPIQAFMTNPTNCSGGPLTTTLSVDSWQAPSDVITHKRPPRRRVVVTSCRSPRRSASRRTPLSRHACRATTSI